MLTGHMCVLQVGNGGLTDAECRTHFGLWAVMKAPLILGSYVPKFTPNQLACVS
jgi:alpha-galactosidase